MTTTELLSELELQGITLAVIDGNLRCEGVGSALSEDLVAELREHKAEIISLMKCGQCGTPLSGPLDQFWWALLDAGPVHLCSAECVFEAWPWRMEVVSDNRN